MLKGPSSGNFIKTTITKIEASVGDAEPVAPTTLTAINFVANKARAVNPSVYSDETYTDENIIITADQITTGDGKSKADTVVVPLGFELKKGDKLKIHLTGSVSRGLTSQSLRLWLSTSKGVGNDSGIGIVSDGDNDSIDWTETLEVTSTKADAIVLKGPGGGSSAKFEKTTITKLEIMKVTE